MERTISGSRLVVILEMCVCVWGVSVALILVAESSYFSFFPILLSLMEVVAHLET